MTKINDPTDRSPRITDVAASDGSAALDACMAFLSGLIELEWRRDDARARAAAAVRESPARVRHILVRDALAGERAERYGRVFPDFIRRIFALHPPIAAALASFSADGTALSLAGEDDGYADFLFDHLLLPLLGPASGSDELLDRIGSVVTYTSDTITMDSSGSELLPPMPMIMGMDDGALSLALFTGDVAASARRPEHAAILDADDPDDPAMRGIERRANLQSWSSGDVQSIRHPSIRPTDGRGWAVVKGMTPHMLTSLLSHGFYVRSRSMPTGDRVRFLLALADMMVHDGDLIGNSPSATPFLMCANGSRVPSGIDAASICSRLPEDCMFHVLHDSAFSLPFDSDDLRWLATVDTSIPPRFDAMRDVVLAMHGIPCAHEGVRRDDFMTIAAPDGSMTSLFAPTIPDKTMRALGGDTGTALAIRLMRELEREGAGFGGLVESGDSTGMIYRHLYGLLAEDEPSIGFRSVHHYHADFSAAVAIRDEDAVRASLAIHGMIWALEKTMVGSGSGTDPREFEATITIAAAEDAMHMLADGYPTDFVVETLLSNGSSGGGLRLLPME